MEFYRKTQDVKEMDYSEEYFSFVSNYANVLVGLHSSGIGSAGFGI